MPPGPTPGPDPAAIGADELGYVPILMYHQLLDDPGPDDRTPAGFRADLERLYEQGYRPVTAADYVAGEIDIPAGRHPVVLTFDDSTVSQARIGADGEPLPDTALGMLEEFGREHPDFEPTATFYVNTYPEPFVDDAVLPWLVEHGYEVGAHGRSHRILSKLDDAEVQYEIGANIAEIVEAVPGYTVTTLALPGGIWPANRALAREGTHDGSAYRLAAVMGVDVVGASSPYAVDFDPMWIPRVANAFADALLDRLESRPELRFTSDGDPDTVTVPADRADDVDAAWEANVRRY